MNHSLLIIGIVVFFALPAFLMLCACIAAARAERQSSILDRATAKNPTNRSAQPKAHPAAKKSQFVPE